MQVHDIKPLRRFHSKCVPKKNISRIFFGFGKPRTFALAKVRGKKLLPIARTSFVAVFFAAYFFSSVFRFDSARAPIMAVDYTPLSANASTEQDQAALEQQLQQVEQQIQTYESGVNESQQQGKTLSSEVKILNYKMSALDLKIKETSLQIKALNSKIVQNGTAITDAQNKVADAKAALEESIRLLNEKDQVSLLELLLSDSQLSDFFAELSAHDAIEARVSSDMDEVKVLEGVLQQNQSDYLNKKEDQVSLLTIQNSEQSDLDATRQEKNQLLALTKGKESLYQKLLTSSQKTAAEIRSQLYKLLGGGELQFGDALKFAQGAASATGVRPALLLAVLDKETALGANVGKCSWKTAMSPTRDQPAFAQITKELGIDPDSMLVSCPIVSDGAYGGAMGLAQFLPSTWILYEDRIRAVVNRTPNPWNPQDAFLAAGFYLADAGASAQTYSAEKRAAAQYYAGSKWRYYLNYYGGRVMQLADDFQSQIDILNRTASL